MASPPSHIFQQILRSLRDHPDDDYDDDMKGPSCGECGMDLEHTMEQHHEDEFLFHGDHHWSNTDACSRCSKPSYDFHHGHKRNGGSLPSSRASSREHHVHWADDDRHELVRSRPRKKYTRHPAKSAPVKPILKQGNVNHRPT
ncbi:hypothetical protein SNE40_004887 [Patella caerulea]|uniref:Uncharacterized protein n=1 Tax=Patella caerulea TaxID=87958 RepID=A0AAN8K5M5_PATCE